MNKQRRKNLLYKLRKKGVRCITKERVIYFPYGRNPMTVVQIYRLVNEFNFYVQFEIV